MISVLGLGLEIWNVSRFSMHFSFWDVQISNPSSTARKKWTDRKLPFCLVKPQQTHYWLMLKTLPLIFLGTLCCTGLLNSTPNLFGRVTHLLPSTPQHPHLILPKATLRCDDVCLIARAWARNTCFGL